APTVRAQEARLALEVLQDPDMQRTVQCVDLKPVTHAPHEPGQTFASVTLALDNPVDESRLVAALQSLPACVLRAKGFFTTRDRPGSIRHVELCGRRLDITDWPHPPAPTLALVLVALKGSQDIKSHFDLALYG
ncbi:MAG: GTP-binding protein, partial [Gammaproteobacteria bacterium]